MVNKKVDKSILQYCAHSLRPNLQTLKKSARNILKRQNIEDIHDLRVSSRRIRSVLEAFSDYLPKKKVKTWQKDIEIITKSFGSIRDLDVQLDIIDKIYNSVEDNKIRAGLRRIRLRINQKRQQKQEDTKILTNSLLENTSIIEMSVWIDEILTREPEQPYFSAELYRLGYKQIQTQLDAFLFYEVFIFDQTRVEELHQMRISAKKLRYALEVFSELYNNETDFALEVARKAQEFLGNIHDDDEVLKLKRQLADSNEEN